MLRSDGVEPLPVGTAGLKGNCGRVVQFPRDRYELGCRGARAWEREGLRESIRQRIQHAGFVGWVGRSNTNAEHCNTYGTENWQAGFSWAAVSGSRSPVRHAWRIPQPACLRFSLHSRDDYLLAGPKPRVPMHCRGFPKNSLYPEIE